MLAPDPFRPSSARVSPPDDRQTRWPSSEGHPRPRRLTARRVAAVLGGLVAVGLLVVAGAVFVLDGQVTRTDVDGLAEDGTGAQEDPEEPTGPERDTTDEDDVAQEVASPSADATGADADPLTLLLLGSDSRDVLTPEERTRLGTGYAHGERTEVMMLVRLDPEADEIRLLSMPRDLVVTRCDGSRGRINVAYAIGEREGVGGLTCAVQTVTDWSGVSIDHVAKVDFRGFVDVVDSIGGVEMYLDEPLQDRRANLDLEAGCQRLDGAEALAFVRARGIDDDTGRNARQHRLLVELRDEISERGIISEPVRSLRLAESVAAALEVDSSLTFNRVRRLVGQHRTTAQGDIHAEAVPGSRITGTEAWLLSPDEEEAARLFSWLVHGPPSETDGGGGSGAAVRDDGGRDDVGHVRGDADGETGAGDVGGEQRPPHEDAATTGSDLLEVPGLRARSSNEPADGWDTSAAGARPQRC